MSNVNFPEPAVLLNDVVKFGIEAVADYLSMSGDASGWEVPERWPQTEIARKIRAKHGLYVWLELPVAKVLSWMSSDPESPLELECERTGGRLDIGLFPATEKPSDATFQGVIELKRNIWKADACNDDADRIRAMRKHFPLCGIVGGMLVGKQREIRDLPERFKEGLGSRATSILSEVNQNKDLAGYSYGFIAALVAN